ncbi:zinc-ribbon domain-containing protein [Neobacillus vireti]|uniref:zinc-ribbon domain-containing protein n=1 Tax=Neobacillus vireti TaxID=220686 RepID=UPI002FFE0F06
MSEASEKDNRIVLRKTPYEKSLLFKNPTLASQWDNEKNKPLTPGDINVSFEGKVWWRCKNNH